MSSKCLQILGLLPQIKKKCLKQNTISAISGEFLIERARAFSSSSKANATHIQLTGRELLFSGFLLRISLFHVNFRGWCFHSRTKIKQEPLKHFSSPWIKLNSRYPRLRYISHSRFGHYFYSNLYGRAPKGPRGVKKSDFFTNKTV